VKNPKVVVIGAGSASFGLSVLGSLALEPALRGGELCLVDIDAEGLEQISRLAHRLNAEWESELTIRSSTDRRDVLEGADFVVLAIAVDREKCWRQDYEIGRRQGIVHYAENGGPGAFAHGARNIAIVMEILRDMEEICPEAWLLNFTNPVPRICIAAARFSKIRAIGICHQLSFGYLMLGVILARDLGIEAPQDYLFSWFDHGQDYGMMDIAGPAMTKVDILAAGLNHFTWMLDIRDRSTGEDLYPLLWERLKTHYPPFEPLTREVAEVFGLFPVPGDCHLCEYLPYTHNMSRNAWERYDIRMYPFEVAERRRDQMWTRIEEMASGKAPIDKLRASAHSERAEKVIAAITGNLHAYEPALNLPNRGYIANLPEGAVVEVPAVVDATGPHGIGVGALPEPIAELCRRQIVVAELAVEAAVTGDRQVALQALALDPMVDDVEVARRLLDDYLEAHKAYLPQFD
jgi:alpha-galactosidase